ncbi:hypothetical protein PYCCODRAFT_1202795 [Trametes coccinea BRFM310]|uniref:Uncharacterized protein n=1 Tax=Trametes coccinea (strain BRFM310) TaxID=1353009 RepID=A0A1Y2I7C3_TRAC3|nr:hypothetical protein PYCCODRAFT_1202795 [Trametes coccinea BRFM310]
MSELFGSLVCVVCCCLTSAQRGVIIDGGASGPEVDWDNMGHDNSQPAIAQLDGSHFTNVENFLHIRDLKGMCRILIGTARPEYVWKEKWIPRVKHEALQCIDHSGNNHSTVLTMLSIAAAYAENTQPRWRVAVVRGSNVRVGTVTVVVSVEVAVKVRVLVAVSVSVSVDVMVLVLVTTGRVVDLKTRVKVLVEVVVEVDVTVLVLVTVIGSVLVVVVVLVVVLVTVSVSVSVTS